MRLEIFLITERLSSFSEEFYCIKLFMQDTSVESFVRSKLLVRFFELLFDPEYRGSTFLQNGGKIVGLRGPRSQKIVLAIVI
jgi:hypothetical protein